MFCKSPKSLPVCSLLAAFLLVTSAHATPSDETSTEQFEPSASEETRDIDTVDMTEIMNDCNETFRTEMSYIESLNNSGSFPDGTDKTAKCFVRCLLEKCSVMSESGEFDTGRAPAFFAAQRASASESDFVNSTAACSNRNETCTCEKSYQFVKCVMELELNKYDTLKSVY